MEFYHKNLDYQLRLSGNMLQKLILKIENTITLEVERNLLGMVRTLERNQTDTKGVSWQTLNKVKETTVGYLDGLKMDQIYLSL